MQVNEKSSDIPKMKSYPLAAAVLTPIVTNTDERRVSGF